MRIFNKKVFKFKKDFIVITCIILSPFAFYLYNFLPKTQIWRNSLFEIDSGKFEDVNYFMWFLSVKLLTIVLLTLWYLTCTSRWRVVLFIPIVLEIFKLLSLTKSVNLGIYHGSINIIETLCYSIPYIIVLIFISKKLNYYKAYNKSVNPLNIEINNQMIKLSNFDNKQYATIKEQLKVLEIQKQNMDKKEYLSRLISLRDQLTIK